jgi:hypothetical protein
MFRRAEANLSSKARLAKRGKLPQLEVSWGGFAKAEALTEKIPQR